MMSIGNISGINSHLMGRQLIFSSNSINGIETITYNRNLGSGNLRTKRASSFLYLQTLK